MKSVMLLLLLCITGTSVVGAEPDNSGPPDQMELCTAPDNCVMLEISQDAYVDHGWHGPDSPKFRYHLDAWEPGFIALTGASLKTDFDGRRQISVITAVRTSGAVNEVYGVRHIILGQKDTVQNITLKWDKGNQGGVATTKLGNPVTPERY